MLDSNSDGFQCLLVGGINYWQGAIVKCGRPGIAGRVTEAQSHVKGRGRRSVTGVYGSVTGIQNKSVTGGMEKRVGTGV